jgi:hypothetical protein
MLRMLEICADRGAWERVLQVCERFVEYLAEGDFGARTRVYKVTAQLQLEGNSDTQPWVQEARALLEELNMDAIAELRVNRARLRRLLDGAASAELAHADLDAALVNAEARTLRAFVPQIHAERAALARACGDEAGHRRALDAAIQISHEIGAPKRAERYELERDTPNSSG